MTKKLLLTFIPLAVLLFFLPQCTYDKNNNQLGEVTNASCPPFNFSPDIPHDVVVDGAIDVQYSINDMSWMTFIALNWPASTKERGVPDRTRVIGGKPGSEGGQSKGAGPTVWETYKSPMDIFLDPPTKPKSFDTPPSLPDSCRNAAGKKVLIDRSKVTEMLEDTTQAGTGGHGILIDQNGKEVWYEVMLDRTIFKHIVDNGYYDKQNIPDSLFNYPSGSNETRSVGSIRVKASWKVLNTAEILSKRFYAREVITKDESGNCNIDTMGLVGLHIVHKTDFKPQWVWATFEHVDNCPTLGNTEELKKAWSFFNPQEFERCDTCYNEIPDSTDVANGKPVQVVREVPINFIAQQSNAKWQGRLKSMWVSKPDFNVWQNYQLVNAQWSRNDESHKPKAEELRPNYLANTTMETFKQELMGANGCINCHSFSSYDFGFQLYKAKSGND